MALFVHRISICTLQVVIRLHFLDLTGNFVAFFHEGKNVLVFLIIVVTGSLRLFSEPFHGRLDAVLELERAQMQFQNLVEFHGRLFVVLEGPLVLFENVFYHVVVVGKIKNMFR